MRDSHFEGWSENYRAVFGCVNPIKKECHCKVCERLEEIYENWVRLSQAVVETYERQVLSKKDSAKEYKSFGIREAPIPGEW